MLKIANHCHYHKAAARHLIEQIKRFTCEDDFTLHIDDSEIKLCSTIQQQQTCFSHSFTDPKLHKRAQQKNQGLLKACNNKKRDISSILDLTAGWGKDSFMLAFQGYQVTMLEQNPILVPCLDYLLHIARQDETQSIYQNLSIQQNNSLSYLQTLPANTIDCCYLDPMFPAHKSTAKPGKELQLLQKLTSNIDIDEVFSLALSKSRYRVVVKRPLHADPLSGKKPDISYKEKTIRFDVYLTLQN